MALRDSETVDKFIVDRTKPHRNSDVARAVRRTRERLSQAAGNPAFDREMLKIHASAIRGSTPAVLLLVLVVGLVGFAAGMGRELLAWMLLTGAGYCALYFLARWTDRAAPAQLQEKALKRRFLALHFASGMGWAYFVLLDCASCALGHIPLITAIILLMIIAATALIAASLRGALVTTFAVPVAAYAALHIRPPLAVEPIMAVLLILSLPFFSYVAHHRNRAAVLLLSYRSEKDALIAELETAKAVSDEARRRAEEANLAKSRFLASMSHELRTPLNAILGFSEVMAKEVLGPIENETYREYARDVHESGRHLLDLINEILDLSRIEAGRYQLNEEPLVLSDVVQECCRMMELKARAKDIRLVQQVEPTLPRLLADERAIRQICLNLLSNAVKFTPSGGEIRVRVGWTAGGGQYIAVRDNGPGIPEDELPVVLAAFGQGSIAIKSAEQGTGLGLPIVQGLANLHGGVLELRSRLREGTEAIVAFPPARVLEELPAIPAEEHAGRQQIA
ncbi:sensor histidine kinase [Chelativorans intermedius]|uniref:histidine kinase n=1 Tax=Chelativorans intermedius TaxID=515947 RepID=A0ABV6DAF1_9HYPH|nr:HAMP domain-containing sensor histidine kinase [Chelativorans intermedius]MCT9000109.1 HAMP domain-containing histidine kinase [Chelativorans intermedius]